MNDTTEPLDTDTKEFDTTANPRVQADDSKQAVISAPKQQIGFKKIAVKMLLAAVIVLLVVAGSVYALYRNTIQTAQRSVPHLVLPDQPKQISVQFDAQYFASGYVTYEPAKFKTASIVLPKITPPLPAVENTQNAGQVIFMTNLHFDDTSNSRQLLMYDLSAQKTYIIADDDSVGSYSNAAIMSNHFVVYVSEFQSDPLTSITSIKITDLDTDQTKTIAQDKASNLPASLCCSVSPDGLRLVIPQTNKFLVYQAGDAQPATFSGDVQVFPKVQGDDNSQYAASQRNFGYPGIVWLDANRFMYAKAHPLQWTVDGQGSHAATNNNGLAIFDLRDGTSRDVAKTSSVSIKWFTSDGTSVILAGYMPNVGGTVDDRSGLIIYKIDNFLDANSQLLELARQSDFQSTLVYSASTHRLYIQPTGGIVGSPDYGSNKAIQEIDTASGVVGNTMVNDLGDYLKVEGIVGPDKLIINKSIGTSNDYYIFDAQSATTEHVY